ncbi:MAG TPA: Asp23/Gls24 family envelope stress response protein [Thermoleophilia bacterium]|nr:Asp23/Gls24 family envelope stress response protein [Acidobacteriota bacterium]NLT93757.1 Asp23/Gls24 family envelope stress response protein [Actinomycetota bacterium]HQH22526.1 Asp23/Gls24 family envelope stress response protein [Thermoleophilia bacterium]
MSQPDLRIPFTSRTLSGGVTVAHQVIARLVGEAARVTYGVVGMQEPAVKRIARFLRGSDAEGVELSVSEGSVDIGLRVVMERGVNIAQVTANLQEQVRYQLERVSGIPVGQINVRVEDLQD